MIGRNGINRQIEHDNGTGTSFGGRAQCKLGAARQFSTGESMTRRLCKARVRAHPHNSIDPIWARDRFKSRANDCFSIDVQTGCQRHRKLIAGDATAHRMRRQHLLQPPGDGNDKLIAAQDSRGVR